ncbi:MULTISPECIES: S-layer homology domain-containing protein [Paenibacillus]|uniref:SLH domain-containing protein n=1 Tax=Paenibacillus albilobatus TaxID=2716884 RepID=A0A919XPL4_9BACL|nr:MULTISPECIES: S-layer homology domain-containing protein [Paenibacillus]GIO33933.1 hypothetical protein J2TS6_50740 [Paenibacillus albilobatus]
MLKQLASVLGIVLVFGWFAAQTPASADETAPSVSLKSTSNGNEITVVVTGEHLKDLYAYDFTLKYDTQKLAYKSAISSKNGFSVDPIVQDGNVRIAHTKVGGIAGDNGTLQLAAVKFARLQKGSAAISLHDVKLVDSKLNAAGTAIQAAISVKDEAPSGQVALKDIGGHWAKAAIEQAVQQGWVTGYANGTFMPDKEVTRIEFAAMLIRALGADGGRQPVTFTDAKQIPAWGLPSVEEAVGRGIMNGYGDGSFGPAKKITRAEMAAMAVRSLPSAEPAGGGKPAAFADSGQIPAWAKPYAETAAQRGIMNGRSGGQFAPRAHATRAEAVVVILALLQQN